MDAQRRTVLTAGLTAGLGAAAAILMAGAGTPAKAEETPPAAATPSRQWPKGKAGEFDFLNGEWRIKNRQLKASKEWEEFDGEATCFGILGGVASIEELRIPARNFSGMGIRLLDAEKQEWADYWVNSKSGVIFTPGMPGGFIDGAGWFEADDVDGDQKIKILSLWDEITPTSCQWRQGISRDGGKNWEYTWIMTWTRV